MYLEFFYKAKSKDKRHRYICNGSSCRAEMKNGHDFFFKLN